MDFNAFRSGGPVIGEALILSHLPENDWRGHWFAHNESEHSHPPICMRDALPGRVENSLWYAAYYGIK